MIKSQETTHPNSCLMQAEEDEPLFVLRANDELAPLVVEEWIRMYDTAKRNLGITQKQIDKQQEARDLAQQMREWKRKHP